MICSQHQGEKIGIWVRWLHSFDLYVLECMKGLRLSPFVHRCWISQSRPRKQFQCEALTIYWGKDGIQVDGRRDKACSAYHKARNALVESFVRRVEQRTGTSKEELIQLVKDMYNVRTQVSVLEDLVKQCGLHATAKFGFASPVGHEPVRRR